jgi:regulator of ribonuclease activity A
MTPTADLCDAYEGKLADGTLRVVPDVLTSFGGVARFTGPVETVRVFEDNPLVKQTLATPGHGRVLVVDGGGSLRCALVGGHLAQLAQQHGWAGVVVFGAVRDVVELAQAKVGVLALGRHPKKSLKVGAGEVGVAVEVAGVRVKRGDFCVVDEDGVLFSDVAL